VVTAATSTPSSPRSSPRYATSRDPDRPTRGDLVAGHLARLRRGRPYPWQWDLGDVAGEIADSGVGFRYRVVVVSVPRRAGKTVCTLATFLDRMELVDDARCWYTAQRREDAAKQFRDEWVPMLDTASLRRRYRVRQAQGSEGLARRQGSSRVQLFPPTDTALHGQNADCVAVDEAWWFDVDGGEAIEAGIRPAQLTRPWAQLWIVSAGGTITSTWLDRWITAGENATPGVCLVDYGAQADAPDYDPGNPAIWATAHPSLGYGFGLEALAAEWATKTSVAAFERAYLNVWPRPSLVVAAAGVDLTHWSAAARPELAPAPVIAIALDVSADRSWAAIAVAGPAGGRIAVEVIDHRPGVGWVAAAVKAAKARWRGVPVVADALVAASIVTELARARVTVDAVGAGDHARACGTFVDLLAAGGLAHRSQGALDDAIAGAARRPLGDAWLWSRRGSTVDISPLVAVTLAGWSAHGRPAAGRPVIAAATPSAPSGTGKSRTRGTARAGFVDPERPGSF
jgi:hypothetical protein